jgi:DNA gyrase subunit A
VGEIPVNHRVTQGVKLIDLEAKEKLVGVARTTAEDDVNGLTGDDESDE